MNTLERGTYTTTSNLLHKTAVYLRYTKPRVWILLVYTAAIGSIIAVSDYRTYSIFPVILAIAATILGSAGAEALTNYFDQDIDSVMGRTMDRPLPSGELSSKSAIALGLILIAGSLLLLLLFRKFYSTGFMALGIFDNVIVYSYLLKKRTPWSIIFGGFSGGFPAVIGWYTVTNQFSLLPWFLFGLVVVWIPIHVWSLAFRYRDDYKKANVPMLPVLYSSLTSAWCISGSAIILILFSLLPFDLGFEPISYMVIVLLLALPMFVLSFKFIIHPDVNRSFRLFKYSSPYLAIVFTLILIYGII